MELQYGQLRRLVPTLSLQRDMELVQALVPAFAEYEINTTARCCACLAQFAHETLGFKYLRELGGPSYFSKYDFREDLGHHVEGMGLRYKGRGFIQLTGQVNYKKASMALGLDLIDHPEWVEQLPIAAKVSCWWWQEHGLNKLADLDGLGAFKKITKVINGGFNGVNSRIRYWMLAKTIWK